MWAECVGLQGCLTQGRTRRELERKMREALRRHLQEPEGSGLTFPRPSSGPLGPDIVSVADEPAVAFSLQLRQSRIRRGLTQEQAARGLGMRNLYSHQRLERKRNPTLETMRRLRSLFPELSLDAVLGE